MSLALYDNYQTILENDHVTILYYADNKLIHHTCHKPVSGESFRTLMEAGADALEELGAIKWLSDDRLNSVLPQEDMDWANANWHPRVAKAGWKYWALVVPEAVLARFAMTRPVGSAFEGGVRTMAFTDLDEAKKWLEGF